MEIFNQISIKAKKISVISDSGIFQTVMTDYKAMDLTN